MDGSAFDIVTRLAGRASTRRLALRSAIGGSVASAVAAIGIASHAGEAEAKKKKKKKKKCPVCEPLLDNAPCTTNLQCCTNETNRACAVPENAGNSDKKCCGATGAPCGGSNGLNTIAPFCCADFQCSSLTATPGTCQPVFSPV
jgi:hypothetical protein